MRVRRYALLAIVPVLAAAAAGTALPAGSGWSAEERSLIASMSLSALPALPADPSNRVADDPSAARLGHRLFFDTRLSSNGKVACATCHDPAKDFQDGVALAKGVGTTDRRTMPITGTAHSPFQFWDGRKDSQWAQALGPLESPVEHGGTRTAYVRTIVAHYRESYEKVFGAMPTFGELPTNAGPVADVVAAAAWRALPASTRDDITSVYVNLGKAIAAYERALRHSPTRFDRYADALARSGTAPAGVLATHEEAGLRLFIGKAQCANCHNGPRLTDDFFHNTGVPAAAGLPADPGRARGAKQVLADEFNCRSRWSDAPAAACKELDFMVADGPELERAFKTPSLRNIVERAPYMHAGQFADLETVVRHYDRAPKAPSGTTELRRLRLNETERVQLVAFLRVLSAPSTAPEGMLGAPR